MYGARNERVLFYTVDNLALRWSDGVAKLVIGSLDRANFKEFGRGSEGVEDDLAALVETIRKDASEDSCWCS